MSDFTYTVELADGAEAGGATSEADAVVLAAAVYNRTGLQALVKDESGNVVAQIGLSQSDSDPQPAQGPYIDEIDPPTGPVGMPPQVLVVFGSDFDEQSVISWDGVALATTYESDNELRARLEIEPGSVVSTDTVAVTVEDSQGYVSNTVYFTWE
jgi:hypothetical protein